MIDDPIYLVGSIAAAVVIVGVLIGLRWLHRRYHIHLYDRDAIWWAANGYILHNGMLYPLAGDDAYELRQALNLGHSAIPVRDLPDWSDRSCGVALGLLLLALATVTVYLWR